MNLTNREMMKNIVSTAKNDGKKKSTAFS